MLSNDDKKLLLSIINEKINNLESKSKEKYVEMEVAKNIRFSILTLGLTEH